MSAKLDIVESFFKLYMIKDLECITTKEIIDLAGCNRSTFYDYFFDKYDVLETTKAFLLNHVKANNPLYLTVILDENDIYARHFIKLVRKYAAFLRPLLNKDISFVHDYKEAIKSIYSGKIIFHPFDSPKTYIEDQVAASVTYQTIKFINGTMKDMEYIQSIRFLFQNAKKKHQQNYILKRNYEILPTIQLRNGKYMELVTQ